MKKIIVIIREGIVGSVLHNIEGADVTVVDRDTHGTDNSGRVISLDGEAAYIYLSNSSDYEPELVASYTKQIEDGLANNKS